MKQTTKRKIAKEIVIIFCCAVLIGLTWTIFWLKNNYTIHQVDKLQTQVAKLTNDIDSIQSSFPKSKTFEEMLISKNISIDVFNAFLKTNNELPTPEEVLGTELEKATVANLRKLYKLLDNIHYSFYSPPKGDLKSLKPGTTVPDWDLPNFYFFKKYVSAEFPKDFADKKELKRIYDFLLTNKCINMGFEEFVFNLEGLPLPPPHDTWTAFEKHKKQREEFKSEITLTKSKIYSANDLTEIAKWISIIVLTIVYPLRFLFLLLKWAVKTLNQKAT